jgi:uncharacterized protein (TIGR02217 family)
MSFAEIRLPGRFEFRTTFDPEFDVKTVELGSGFEQRNLIAKNPRRRGDIGSRNLITSDYELLYQFYMARRGKWQGFRFRNPTDHEVEDSPLVPDGGPTVQLRKVYSDGAGNTFARDIKKPASGKTDLTRGGSDYTPASIDTTTGIVALAKDKDLTITNVTAASPAEVTTSSNHGLSGGEEVYITGTGLSDIDDQVWTVTVVDTDTVSLDGSDTSGTSGSSSGALEQYVQSDEDLRYSGTYDTPVRFDGPWPNEYLAESQDGSKQVVAVGPIPIVELFV